MRIEGVPFATVDWDAVPETEHPGASGRALWRTVEVGNLRIRKVRYTPGYLADHWCEKGHIVLCWEGEFTTEHKDGTRHVLKRGMSYQVADGDAPHRTYTESGATLFIVD